MNLPTPSSSERPPAVPVAAHALATFLGAELVGDGALMLSAIESLEHARPGELTFIRTAAYTHAWKTSRASAAIVSRAVPIDGVSTPSRALLIVPDADLAMARVLTLFATPAPTRVPGIHSSASVDPSANVAPSASIGPGCSIGVGARIGPRSVLVSQVHVGAGASIGEGCTLHPHTSILDRCTIGDRSILHSGVVIGADGFGYMPSPDGKGLLKVPQIGIVAIGSDVEIGANTCIDRAKFGATTIGDGTKIDNLVQIGHNCRIGRSCIICGTVGIAGSVTIGDGVVIGGGVGIADNLTIGDRAQVGAFAGVANNIPAGETWLGAPAGPAEEWRRTLVSLRRLGRRPKEPRG